jgi:gluconolactonase
VRSDGSIYFSDPWYGRMPVYGVERPRQQGFQGVYRVPPGGGQPLLVVDRNLFEQPNGLCFSPDEKLLYVNDTVRALIRVFDVHADGTLGTDRIFASGIRSELEPGVPDGMKCDSAGNIWVTAPGGVWVYSPSGALLGKVRVPELVANLHWGKSDWRTLFMCATHSLYAVRTKIGPRVEPFMRSTATAAGMSATSASAAPERASIKQGLALDPSRCALIIQDMQNDVMMEGGAFASSGSPQHAREQNVVENIRRLAEACRARGVMVIHVWFVVEPGAPGFTLNAPLFEGLADAKAMVRGTWGAQPAPGLEPQPGDHIVEKIRMSAFEGSKLETVLKSGGRDTIIDTGAWTNMSIEHTARTAADKGYFVIVPEDCCSTMNADWHRASVQYAMTNVAAVTKSSEVIAALG